MMNTAQKQWIRMIHVAKTKLNLDDERYRALLTGACGVESSKEIKTWKQYDDVMASFAKLGFDYKSKSYKAGILNGFLKNRKGTSGAYGSLLQTTRATGRLELFLSGLREQSALSGSGSIRQPT